MANPQTAHPPHCQQETAANKHCMNGGLRARNKITPSEPVPGQTERDLHLCK